jgi:thioredoxin-related protein
MQTYISNPRIRPFINALNWLAIAAFLSIVSSARCQSPGSDQNASTSPPAVDSNKIKADVASILPDFGGNQYCLLAFIGTTWSHLTPEWKAELNASSQFKAFLAGRKIQYIEIDAPLNYQSPGSSFKGKGLIEDYQVHQFPYFILISKDGNQVFRMPLQSDAAAKLMQRVTQYVPTSDPAPQ